MTEQGEQVSGHANRGRAEDHSLDRRSPANRQACRDRPAHAVAEQEHGPVRIPGLHFGEQLPGVVHVVVEPADQDPLALGPAMTAQIDRIDRVAVPGEFLGQRPVAAPVLTHSVDQDDRSPRAVVRHPYAVAAALSLRPAQPPFLFGHCRRSELKKSPTTAIAGIAIVGR